METACPPDAGWGAGLMGTIRNGPMRRWIMRRRRKCITPPMLTGPNHRHGRRCGREVSPEDICGDPSPPGLQQSRSFTKRLEKRPPAAVKIGTLEKRRGRTGGAQHHSFSLFESSLKRGRKQQTTITITDSRPEESILNYAFRGLKDGVRLKWPVYYQVPSPVFFDDEPNESLPNSLFFSGASMNLQFQVYSRFIPGAANSIPVTLSFVTWNVQASTTYTSGTGWVLDPGSSIGGPIISDSDAFPSWTTTY